MTTDSIINRKAVNEIGRLPTFPLANEIQAIGITQRDWVATLALQGIAAKGLEVKADRAMTQEERDIEMARRSYALADAMLTVRAETMVRRQPAAAH
ncbi:MAG: hypothetical protein KDB27_34095 [Planctomycetales bacterium]|nr:hypothetical protein [Planctomycetales bacterium]